MIGKPHNVRLLLARELVGGGGGNGVGGLNKTCDVEANVTVYLDQGRLQPFLADACLQDGNRSIGFHSVKTLTKEVK